jgi:ABC-type protease/lipase transport system fused ATPase/permease subunit
MTEYQIKICIVIVGVIGWIILLTLAFINDRRYHRKIREQIEQDLKRYSQSKEPPNLNMQPKGKDNGNRH